MQKYQAIKIKTQLDVASTILSYALSGSVNNLSAEEFKELKQCIGISMGELAVYKADLCVKYPFLDNI